MTQQVSIALVGDSGAGYREGAAREALDHCSASVGTEVRTRWFETQELAPAAGVENVKQLAEFGGVWIVPGSPYKSLEGVLAAIRFAREGSVPLLGTCAGFQHLILEYARNVLGKADAVHAEYDPDAKEQAISRLACSLVGRRQRVKFDPNSMVGKIYGREWAEEEFRCNYGLNTAYAQTLRSTDLRIAGWDETGETRVVELANHQHPFFVGTLFIPQYSSSAAAPHPLICEFVRAAALKVSSSRSRVESLSCADEEKAIR